jgi:beta-lactamase superfamily II metal-dependent hydrolase
MRSTLIALTALAAITVSPAAQTPAKPAAGKTLDIYVSDVEGGKATLFVAPTGETVLIDSGNPGPRDQERIAAVLAAAGVKSIDFLVSTHYHVDHIGGMTELAKTVPIKTFVDHGPTVEPKEQINGFQAAYAELRAKAKHLVVKPGDKLPIGGIDWQIVTAGGKAIKKPLPGGGKPNPHCADFKPQENLRDPENGQSVGSVITFGKFKTIDLGDLLWDNEFDLMCPNNPIGKVDVYLVSHHGIDASGSTTLVHGLEPRVAVMQNGTRKGGTLQTTTTLNSSPNLEDIWQLHWSYNVGVEGNPPGLMIANVDEPAVIAQILTAPPRGGGPGPGAAPGGSPAPATMPAPGSTPPAATPPAAAPPTAATPTAAPPTAGAPATTPADPAAAGRQGGGGGGRGGGTPPHTGPANWIKISARADGSFTVTNSRNGFSRTYTVK